MVERQVIVVGVAACWWVWRLQKHLYLNLHPTREDQPGWTAKGMRPDGSTKKEKWVHSTGMVQRWDRGPYVDGKQMARRFITKSKHCFRKRRI